MSRGPEEADASSRPAPPPFGPAAALAAALGVGALFVVVPLVRLAIPATDLPEPFPPQHQDAETLAFVLAFAVVLPLACIGGLRLAAALLATAGRQRTAASGAVLIAGLALVALAARAVEAAGLGDALEWLPALAVVWWLVGVALVLTAARPTSRLRLPPAGPAVAAAAGLVGTAALTCVDLGSLAPIPLVIGAAFAVALAVAPDGLSVPRLPRGWGLTVDVAVVVLVLFAVVGLEVITPEDPGAAFETRIIQFHQDFFLGPANQVQHGDAMLVDTLSQYGVGAIYAIAGWFELVPIGNGTLGLLDSLLSALVFAGAYGVLRLAGVRRPLAVAAMAVAVVALVYGLAYPVGALLQHGAIRFGAPIVVLVGAAIESRRPGPAPRALQLAGLGVASVWALEAFGYTLFVLAAVVAARAALAPAGARRRLVTGWAIAAVGACAGAHLLLAGLTLIGAGELPDWGGYIETLRDFLSGRLGDLTYDFGAWSPALLYALLLFCSAACLALLVRLRRPLAEANGAAVVAIAGTTAYGVALFSYFVNRSAEHILPYVSLPAVMVVAVWLGLSARAGIPARARGLSLAAAAAAAALMVATAWSQAGERLGESALAHAVPGGRSIGAALDRLAHLPPIRPGAQEGVRLLDERMPTEERSLVLTDADLGIEILWRADRASALPFGDPWEDSFVADQHVDAVVEAIAELEPGDRLLLDEPAVAAYRGYLAEPQRDPLSDPFRAEALVPTGLASLQELALKEIGKRFALHTIAVGENGLRVVKLAPRARY